jgi:hypoxanthine phosphoribosyltransferase
VSERGPAEESRLREIYSAEDVRARIDALSDRLYRDYADTPVLFVVIAEGARRFADELVERLRARRVNPEVVSLRVWRTKGTALGEVQTEAIDPSTFEDRDVLILDDVVDEGRTLEAVMAIVEEGEPRSTRIAVLVDKHGRRVVQVPLEYVGFEVGGGWVVGFGMDLDGHFRELDSLAIVQGTD